MNFRVSVIKKNQIITSMVILMLVVAGYLNYTYDPSKNYDVELAETMTNNLGDAYLVDSSSISTNMDSIAQSIEASSKVTTAEEYFSSTRIDRENSFDKQLEVYSDIISNKDISTPEKEMASKEIVNLNNLRNAITICENLIKVKGYDDVVVLVNNDSVNVILYSTGTLNIDDEEIKSIIQSELKIGESNIHITKL